MTEATRQNTPLVEMSDMVKHFPAVLANDHVDFDVRSGEIHGLLGENGAGKTTLMKILYGMYAADEGKILINGKPVAVAGPVQAIGLGIGMVHQHFMLVPDMTVLENVILGLKTLLAFGPKMTDCRVHLLELSKKYGLPINPDTYVWQLSVGEKQRVEILKALYRKVSILILDEPTAVLAPQEVDQLFEALRGLRKEGLGIVLITHKLEEVMKVADRVTILKDGKKVTTANVVDVNPKRLARLMIGRELAFKVERQSVKDAKTTLEVQGLRVLDDRGAESVRGISFSICQGEIFGIAGVSGNGQRELIEAIVGLRPAFGGRIMIRGKDFTNRQPHEILTGGVAYVPEERNKDGCIHDFSVAENLVLKSQRSESLLTDIRLPLLKPFLLSPAKIENVAKKLVEQFDIRTPSVKTPTRSLSGGNLQRVILARELSGKPELVIAAQPTRGLDIAATEYVRRKLVEIRNERAGVLFVSEDLNEILSLSDRIGVMYKGEFAGVFNSGEVSIDDVGLMMTGMKRR